MSEERKNAYLAQLSVDGRGWPSHVICIRKGPESNEFLSLNKIYELILVGVEQGVVFIEDNTGSTSFYDIFLFEGATQYQIAEAKIKDEIKSNFINPGELPFC